MSNIKILGVIRAPRVSEKTARIQEMHIFLYHLLCAAADETFTGGA